MWNLSVSVSSFTIRVPDRGSMSGQEVRCAKVAGERAVDDRHRGTRALATHRADDAAVNDGAPFTGEEPVTPTILALLLGGQVAAVTPASKPTTDTPADKVEIVLYSD